MNFQLCPHMSQLKESLDVGMVGSIYGQSFERDLISRRGRQWPGSVLGYWNDTLPGRKLGKSWAISRGSSLTQNMTFPVPSTVLKDYKQQRKGRNNQVEPRLPQNRPILPINDRKQISQLGDTHFQELLLPEFSSFLQRHFPGGLTGITQQGSFENVVFLVTSTLFFFPLLHITPYTSKASWKGLIYRLGGLLLKCFPWIWGTRSGKSPHYPLISVVSLKPGDWQFSGLLLIHGSEFLVMLRKWPIPSLKG